MTSTIPPLPHGFPADDSRLAEPSIVDAAAPHERGAADALFPEEAGERCGAFAVTLKPVPQSVRLARALVRYAFVRWGLPGLVYDGTLVISELTSNAIRHSPVRGLVVCRVLLPEDRGPVIEVWDGDPALPTLQGPAEPLPECGRGLHVVANLVANLAVFPSPWGAGKIVQAVMRVP